MVPQTEGHILGGSEIEVNGVIFQFITDPAFVVEDEDFYLSFSVQDAVTDIGLENIQVVITFFEDSGRVYDIIEVSGNLEIRFLFHHSLLLQVPRLLLILMRHLFFLILIMPRA